MSTRADLEARKFGLNINGDVCVRADNRFGSNGETDLTRNDCETMKFNNGKIKLLISL